MSILENNNQIARKTASIYIGISLFCIAFGWIYEIFSHGVYAYSMLYFFLFPLIGGAFLFFWMEKWPQKRFPSSFVRQVHHLMIATWTIGNCLQGVLEIYGTDSTLIKYFWIAGAVLIIFEAGLYIKQISLKE